MWQESVLPQAEVTKNQVSWRHLPWVAFEYYTSSMGCLPLCGLAPVWILLRFESRHGVVRVRIRCNDDVIEWRINNMHVYIHVMWWYLFEGSGGSSYLDDGEERDTGCGGAGDAPTKCVCPRWILVTIILERTVLSKTENHDKLKTTEKRIPNFQSWCTLKKYRVTRMKRGPTYFQQTFQYGPILVPNIDRISSANLHQIYPTFTVWQRIKKHLPLSTDLSTPYNHDTATVSKNTANRIEYPAAYRSKSWTMKTPPYEKTYSIQNTNLRRRKGGGSCKPLCSSPVRLESKMRRGFQQRFRDFSWST